MGPSRVQPYFIKRSLSEIWGITAGADPVGFTLGDPLGDVLRGFLGANFLRLVPNFPITISANTIVLTLFPSHFMID